MHEFSLREPCPAERVEIAVAQLEATVMNVASGGKPKTLKDTLRFTDAWKPREQEEGRYSAADLATMKAFGASRK